MTWFGYAPAQWALFFFLYSFLGWVWESCYVSLRQGRWVNRGFLNGPLLPIYGFGAVAILLFTLPVAANPLLVFLMGMTGATLLEYVTGWTMERLFHVRYWDYSMYRFNLNGYICLPASLCWGAFSLVMLRLIHPVVSGWVAMLAPAAALTAALALSAFFAVDLLVSLRQAVDMRSPAESGIRSDPPATSPGCKSGTRWRPPSPPAALSAASRPPRAACRPFASSAASCSAP